MQQGGVSADGEKVTDIHAEFTKEQFAGEGIVLKKGKKSFQRILMNRKK